MFVACAARISLGLREGESGPVHPQFPTFHGMTEDKDEDGENIGRQTERIIWQLELFQSASKPSDSSSSPTLLNTLKPKRGVSGFSNAKTVRNLPEKRFFWLGWLFLPDRS